MIFNLTLDMSLESFEDYLVSKKIESTSFKENEPSLWNEWKALFNEIHPDSFNAQKLYAINKIRRKYQLKTEVTSIKKPIKKGRPIIKR